MTINIKGRLLDLSKPIVMGILNVTPDSFYDGGKLTGTDALLQQAEKMLREGATILDIGGMSSRPGAEIIGEDEELERVLPAVKAIVANFPDAIISIDTIRAKVAWQAIQAGAHIVNDISAGRLDDRMIETVATALVPYVIMHMQGLPHTMQQNPEYANVTTEVMDFLAERIAVCQKAGITDIILDPGFGFGKSVEHNYTLLRNLKYFANLNLPVLAGVSRKSMICKPLGVNPDKALNGTTAANTIALLNGASILRVHDVKEAMEAIKIVESLML
ncbi:MAG TPA: dihydropteroate synthase [Chitinophagales bacterium]|nr:dihydropteroate synthase [Chitinophagales bacterium]